MTFVGGIGDWCLLAVSCAQHIVQPGIITVTGILDANNKDGWGNRCVKIGDGQWSEDKAAQVGWAAQKGSSFCSPRLHRTEIQSPFPRQRRTGNSSSIGGAALRGG